MSRFAVQDLWGRLRRALGAAPADAGAQPAPGDQLDRLVSDPDLARRLDAAMLLAQAGALPEPALVLAAVGLPGTAPTPHHRAILRALASAYPQVMAELSFAAAFSAARAALVEALGAVDDPGAASCLALHSADRDPQVRLAALRAACQIGDPGAARWTMQLLDDPAESVIVKAIHTCGLLGADAALPRLQTLTAHPSWWVRTRAVQAIASLGALRAVGDPGVRAA